MPPGKVRARCFGECLRAEAGAAGATDISISGNAIINPALANLNPAIAARYGFSFSQVNPTTISCEDGDAVIMTAEALKGIWESIFRRKGGDGAYTVSLTAWSQANAVHC